MRNVDPEKMTKAERMHWGYGVDAMRMIEWDILGHLRQVRAVPDDWSEIWKDKDRRDARRVRVTARLDAEVVKFFKAMGPGYQHRMNRVLRAYMHFRLAKLIDGPDTTDFVLKPEEVMAANIKRPEWGDEALAVLMTEARLAGMRSMER